MHGKTASSLCWQELRSKIRRIVLADRKAKRATPTDVELRKMKIPELQKMLADEEAKQRTRYENCSVTTILTQQALTIATELSEQDWNFDGTATEDQNAELEAAWDKYNRLTQHQQTAQQKSLERQRREQGRRRAQAELRVGSSSVQSNRIDQYFPTVFDQEDADADTDSSELDSNFALQAAREYADQECFTDGTATATQTDRLQQLWATFNGLQ